MINKKLLGRLKLAVKSFLCIAIVFSFFVSNVYAISLNLATTPLGEEKGFVTPVGIATDGTDVFVADYGANAVFKITTSNFNVAQLISIQKPIAIAFYNAKLYVIAEGIGGKVYNASNGTFTGVTFATDVVKPSDMVISPAGTIYVADMSVNKIKTYNATTGISISSFGDTIPFNNVPANEYGNGKFYLVSGLAYDTTTDRLIVTDSGNVSPYIQVGSKYSYKTKTWTLSANHFGKPKGKLQIYDTNTSTWIRQAVTHGTQSSYGQLINLYGITADNNYIYMVDGISKKIMVISNVANDANAPLWSGRSGQNLQKLNANEVAVSDSTNSNFDPNPSRYATVHIDSVSLGGLSGEFILFKDLVRVGSYLVVTDTTGRVFYFTIS